MAAQKISKGDTRRRPVRQGQGQTGEVIRAMPKEGKVIVSGVNVHARHRKPSQTNPQGGIERKEAPLHVSNVAIATADGKPTPRPLRGARRQEGPRRGQVRRADPWLTKKTRSKRPGADGRQVELVGEAEKAEAEAVEACPRPRRPRRRRPRRSTAKAAKTPTDYKPRLKADYDERIVPAMIERFGYKNKLEVPRLDKIVINMGVGEATQDKKRVETAAAEMQADRRPEAGDHQGQEVDRPVQAARRHADRLQGHACAASACTSSSIGW